MGHGDCLEILFACNIFRDLCWSLLKVLLPPVPVAPEDPLLHWLRCGQVRTQTHGSLLHLLQCAPVDAAVLECLLVHGKLNKHAISWHPSWLVTVYCVHALTLTTDLYYSSHGSSGELTTEGTYYKLKVTLLCHIFNFAVHPELYLQGGHRSDKRSGRYARGGGTGQNRQTAAATEVH